MRKPSCSSLRESESANRPTSYKVAGATYADADGSTDLAEFINVSKDDAFAYPRVVHKVYPPTVNVRMKDAVKPFIQSCADASSILIDVFNQKLGLPEGTLAALHRTELECISESRCIKVPPPPKDTKIALGQHTDFGRYRSSTALLSSELPAYRYLLQYFFPGEPPWWPSGACSEWRKR